MKEFSTIQYDSVQCRKEIDRLEAMLDSGRELSERADLQPLFKDCPQLSAIIGASIPNIGLADQLAYEFPIFGDFAADMIVGNFEEMTFCAIELEDARANSIFNKAENRATSQWGTPPRTRLQPIGGLVLQSGRSQKYGRLREEFWIWPHRILRFALGWPVRGSHSA